MGYSRSQEQPNSVILSDFFTEFVKKVINQITFWPTVSVGQIIDNFIFRTVLNLADVGGPFFYLSRDGNRMDDGGWIPDKPVSVLSIWQK